MALTRYLLTTVAITVSIGVSTVYAWNPNIHRYESYDLERGPVFYEAYYPDSNEEARGNYQEKRFFDRGAVLEKTYQVPSQRAGYPEDAVRLENYQNRAETFLRDERFRPEADARALDIKEITNLARRAISRDLENWNTLENYLDRAKYQEPSSYRREIEPGYGVRRSVHGVEQSSPLKDAFKDLRRDLYEEVREEPDRRIQSATEQRGSNARRLTVRDLAGRDSLGTFGAIQQQEQPREQEGSNVGSQRDPESIANPYPTENIFAPRPQVINYIFSKKPAPSQENKAQTVAEAKVAEEAMPRNYGDNLIQEEIQKEEGKDVKVTSIEVSEVPRHKTRHHHGDWPKRDYSHRHQP